MLAFNPPEVMMPSAEPAGYPNRPAKHCARKCSAATPNARSSDGRRVLVDAIFGYAIARNEIIRHASHAVFSGTLVRDDQT